MNSGAITAGARGGGAATAGSAFESGIFILGNTGITISSGASQTATVRDGERRHRRPDRLGRHAARLPLAGANTYSGDTVINGGSLAVSADNNLGAATGGISFGGGTQRCGRLVWIQVKAPSGLLQVHDLGDMGPLS